MVKLPNVLTAGRIGCFVKPEQIKELRTREGLTQQALADCLGVTVRTVKHWESGSRNVSLTAEKLIGALWPAHQN